MFHIAVLNIKNMETLKLLSFIVMVVLEVSMIVIITVKNKSIQGQNAFKLAMSLLGVLVLTIFSTYKYFDLDGGWNGLLSFMFVIVMILTYAIYEYEVRIFNVDAYNDSKRAFRIIKWISIVTIIINIITTMPKGSPYWISVGIFFYWKIIHYM